MADERAVHQRREANFQAMRSPASLALAGLSIVAVVCATVFYDTPIMYGDKILSYFAALSSLS